MIMIIYAPQKTKIKRGQTLIKICPRFNLNLPMFLKKAI